MLGKVITLFRQCMAYSRACTVAISLSHLLQQQPELDKINELLKHRQQQLEQLTQQSGHFADFSGLPKCIILLTPIITLQAFLIPLISWKIENQVILASYHTVKINTTSIPTVR